MSTTFAPKGRQHKRCNLKTYFQVDSDESIGQISSSRRLLDPADLKFDGGSWWNLRRTNPRTGVSLGSIGPNDDVEANLERSDVSLTFASAFAPVAPWAQSLVSSVPGARRPSQPSAGSKPMRLVCV